MWLLLKQDYLGVSCCISLYCIYYMSLHFLYYQWCFSISLGFLPCNLYDCFFYQKKNIREIKQLLREAPLKENRKWELSCSLHLLFKDWLYGNFHHLNAIASNKHMMDWHIWLSLDVIHCQIFPFCFATQAYQLFSFSPIDIPCNFLFIIYR